jgi:sporulation protein YlmC with PRC-barrel domain
MKRLFETTALALVLALPGLLAAPASGFAQEQNPAHHQAVQQGAPPSGEAQQGSARATITVAAASDIVGRTVRDHEGRDAGRVEQLMVNAVTGDVDYLIIGADDAFDIGNKLIAVPWNKRVDPALWGNDSLTLDTSIDRLRQAPRLDQSDLAKLVEPTEMAQIVSFYATPKGQSGSSQPGQNGKGQQGGNAPQAGGNGNQQAQNGAQPSQGGPQPQSAQAGGSSQQPGGNEAGGGAGESAGQTSLLVGRRIVRTIVPVSLTQADTIADAAVRMPNGQEVGRVDQVMIDTDQGRVAYLLVSRGETLGMGGEWVPVPIEALAWSPRNGSFTLETSARLEQVHGFPKQRLPSQVSTAQLAQLYETYGLGPNGGVASAGGNGQAAGMPMSNMPMHRMQMGQQNGMQMGNMPMRGMQMGQQNGMPSYGSPSNGGERQGYAPQYAMPNYPQRGPGMAANRGGPGPGPGYGPQGYPQQNGQPNGYAQPQYNQPQYNQQFSSQQPSRQPSYGQPGYGQAYGQGQSYPPQGYGPPRYNQPQPQQYGQAQEPYPNQQPQYGARPDQPQYGQPPAYSGSSQPGNTPQGNTPQGAQPGSEQGMQGPSPQQ